jgi:hypothetical protein
MASTPLTRKQWLELLRKLWEESIKEKNDVGST